MPQDEQMLLKSDTMDIEFEDKVNRLIPPPDSSVYKDPPSRHGTIPEVLNSQNDESFSKRQISQEINEEPIYEEQKQGRKTSTSPQLGDIDIDNIPDPKLEIDEVTTPNDSQEMSKKSPNQNERRQMEE